MDIKKDSIDSQHLSYKSTTISPQIMEADDQIEILTDVLKERENRRQLKIQKYKIKQKTLSQSVKRNHEELEQVDEKMRRRSRNDPVGRVFKCGCGKMYLSYPALFTHMKQKHGGKQLIGTIRPIPSGLTKRGRPRKTKIEQQYNSNENHIQNPIPKVLRLKLDPFVMNLFVEFEEIVQGSIIPQQGILYQKFINYINKIKSQRIKQLSLKMPIDEIFSIYLYNMASVCNSCFFSFLQQIFICLRACLNQNHETIFKGTDFKIFRWEVIQDQDSTEKQFTETNSCQFVPLICDFFVLHYASRKLKKFDQKLLSYVIQDFCFWLEDSKLTRIRLLKKEDNPQQDQQNLPIPYYQEYEIV